MESITYGVDLNRTSSLVYVYTFVICLNYWNGAFQEQMLVIFWSNIGAVFREEEEEDEEDGRTWDYTSQGES